MIDRRRFLIGSAVAVGSARAWGQSPAPAKLDRIAVMSASFAPLLKGMARPGNPKATLDLMDLPAMVAERFGIRRVEFQHVDFPSTENDYLDQFRDKLKKSNSLISQITLDFANLNVSSPDPVILLETIELTRRWIDYAAALGCPRVRVDLGDFPPKAPDSALAALKKIGRYAQAKRVFVTVENRPRDTSWEALVELIEAAGIRADPACGNFRDSRSRTAGLAALYRLAAGNCHVQHLPEKFDTTDAIRISKDSGFQGIYTIDAPPGHGADPCAPVETVLCLLLANI